MASEPIHEWLCKTNFSFLKGASHPHALLESALALGYSSVCINDFDGLYGAARTYNDLQVIKKKRGHCLKLNYGTEIHIQPDHALPLLKQQSLVLNAFSWNGYKNICQIISRSHRDSKNEAWLSIDELSNSCLQGVFAIVPMRGGLDHFAKQTEDLEKLRVALSGELYLAITKTFNRMADAKIKKAYQMAAKHNLQTLFSQDVFFSHRSEKAFHDLLTAIQQNQRVDQCLAYHLPNGERSLHSPAHFRQIYKNFPQFQKTMQLMADLNERSQFCLSQIRYQYPKEFIPEGHTPQSYLELKTWEGAKQRYGENIPSPVVSTLSRELDLIEELNFADYFLTVWDIVAWARSQNILCQGRGSAANSSVCFALGITSCDPSLFDLLFERFVSKERGDPPDIDVDFEHERREEVIQYIYRRYGRKKAAMVANVITFKSKGALRAVGKALGAPESLLKQSSDLCRTVAFRRESLGAVLQEVKKKNQHPKVPSFFSWSLWEKFATQLYGFPRHLGLHSGGFIISQHNIDHLVPQEPASMPGRTVIQWCKDDIEELGFFKIDCLALGMLTALRKSFALVKEKYNVDLDLYNIPQEDKATYTMIQKADTVGVFQIESRAQMSMLPRLKPKTFYDLVIEIAIIRPGPIQGKVIHPYLRRRDGLEPVTYPDDSIKDILSKTLGVILFQEQLMRIAIALGDFTPGEANELRKHIGSWNSKSFSRNLNPYIQKLFTGLKQRKVNSVFIQQMVEQMKGFSEYGFPESHSISFAFIAYASCYLKCHYPAAFFTSVLNSQPMGFYSPHALLQAARRKQVPILPLCVNHSHWDHQLEKVPQKEGRPEVYGIRLGFRLVSGLSEKAVQEITRVRQQRGPWRDLDDFIQTTSIYRDDYSALAAANSFQAFGLSRFDAIWRAEAVPYKQLLDVDERKLQWRSKNTFEKAQMDFRATGTTLETHPVQVLRQSYWHYNLAKNLISLAKDLERIKVNTHVHTFGMTLIKQAPPSAKGMVFITLEDESGFVNLAFTPQVYKKFYPLVEGSGFLCVSGRLQKASNYHSILVTQVHSEKRGDIQNLYQDSAPTSQNVLNIKPRNYY